MLFGRKNKKASVPALIEARAFYGFAFHFVDTSTPEGVDSAKAICGYANCLPASSVREVTKAGVLKTWANQHESWHWCKECVAALFDIPVSEISPEKLAKLI